MLGQIMRLSEIIQPNQQKIGGLYLSGLNIARNEDIILEQNIRCVLTIMSGTPQQYSKNSKINHKIISVEDILGEDIKQYFEETYNFIESNITNTNVLVHCQMGISRSSTIIIAYFMKKNKIDFKTAFEMIQLKRSVINPNSSFRLQLEQYEQIILNN